MTEAIQKPFTMPLGRRGIGAAIDTAVKEIATLDPNVCKNRIALVCDDSGSMSGDKITNAHTAVSSFCNNCQPKETSICIYPLNADSKPLSCNYELVTMYWNSIQATGGTPLYTVLKKLIEQQSNMTRAVVFSDGSPTDGSLLGESLYGDNTVLPKEVVKLYKDKEINIDTIYIGLDVRGGYDEMKKLAELTGGIFIHFKDSSSLSQGLKYLAPAYRALLANPEIKAKIERGEKI